MKIKIIIPIITIFLIFISLALVSFLCYYKQDNESALAEIEKEKSVEWGLCYEDGTKKRCGVVEKIIFHGPQKKIVLMRVYFPSTGVRTDFFRDPPDEVGLWTQPGKKGTWTLNPTTKGYAGVAHNDKEKNWRADLIVEPIVTIK